TDQIQIRCAGDRLFGDDRKIIGFIIDDFVAPELWIEFFSIKSNGMGIPNLHRDGGSGVTNPNLNEGNSSMQQIIRILRLGIPCLVLLTFCSEKKLPTPSNAHPESWMQKGSAEFHGAKVIASGYLSCTACHGADLSGGDAQVACHDCHVSFPHPDEWMNLTSASFHGEAIAADNWSMSGCQGCHGSDYRGGSSGASCYTCHADENGPEACNTCHGNQDNAAPPEDLSGQISRTSLGVGAHQFHLDKGARCSTCHQMPASFEDASHIDASPQAEVNTALAWQRTTGLCTTGCHSDTTKNYVWNN
ncbi:hypothetical protein JXO59_10205, partial [candidate division KSB1 bacterium]|nr:hypothetical protein [candidate division KSB1 bacterium]